jgi:hypothetical protein
LVVVQSCREEKRKQAGAELCQAQAQVGLTAVAGQILMLSSMEVVFLLSKNHESMKNMSKLTI